MAFEGEGRVGFDDLDQLTLLPTTWYRMSCGWKASCSMRPSSLLGSMPVS